MKTSTRFSQLLVCVILGCVIFSAVSICAQSPVTSGAIVQVRGGYGVVVRIDNGRGSNPHDDNPLQWEIRIEGDFVLFGRASGTIASSSVANARTRLFPPAIGFGPVTITIEASKQGSVISQVTRSGFMIGPFVFLS